MRVLGLDVGSKTIGLAVCDETGPIASPLETLSRRGTAKDVEQVAEIARQQAASSLVVGLPLDEEEQIGPRASRVLVLVEALRQAGLTVETIDERFSTIEAEALLREGGLSRERRKRVVDKVAAAVILQRWLDARRQAGSQDRKP